MFFEIVRLEQSRAVVEFRGEEEVAFLFDNEGAPDNEVGEVSFAAGATYYDHEGISGGCTVSRRAEHNDANLHVVWGLIGLALLTARRRKRPIAP